MCHVLFLFLCDMFKSSVCVMFCSCASVICLNQMYVLFLLYVMFSSLSVVCLNRMYVLCLSCVKFLLYVYVICILLPFFPCAERKKSGDIMQAVCERTRQKKSGDRVLYVCMQVEVTEFCMFLSRVLCVLCHECMVNKCMCHECWLCNSSLLLYIKHCNAFHYFHSTLIITFLPFLS